MSRKLTKVDFARIWEVIPKLSNRDWDELVARRQEILSRAAPTGKPKPQPRKPKPGAPEGGTP